jgi:EPS-associated MarR family transcriptional regulator
MPSQQQPSDSAAHLGLLRLLEEHPEYSQRELAQALGVSLGKTHYLLKALLGKGLVKAQNFQQSPNKLGYMYRLTPTGFAHRLQLTRTFLVRKEQEYQMLKHEIVSLRQELASRLPEASAPQDPS